MLSQMVYDSTDMKNLLYRLILRYESHIITQFIDRLHDYCLITGLDRLIGNED